MDHSQQFNHPKTLTITVTELQAVQLFLKPSEESPRPQEKSLKVKSWDHSYSWKTHENDSMLIWRLLPENSCFHSLLSSPLYSSGGRGRCGSECQYIAYSTIIIVQIKRSYCIWHYFWIDTSRYSTIHTLHVSCYWVAGFEPNSSDQSTSWEWISLSLLIFFITTPYFKLILK